jgi:hypothetical protein
MPPHCDTLDGPVVKAARLALERGKVNLILPYVPRAADAELRRAFDRASRVRTRTWCTRACWRPLMRTPLKRRSTQSTPDITTITRRDGGEDRTAGPAEVGQRGDRAAG